MSGWSEGRSSGRNLSAPRPGAGELVLRVEASGICSSDLMEWYRVPRAPLVLGHEVAGTVHEVGEALLDREGVRHLREYLAHARVTPSLYEQRG